MKMIAWILPFAGLVTLLGAPTSRAADDDISRLDLRTPWPSSAGASGMGQFAHADRVQADEDDIEDVTLRYWLGAWRGQRVNAGYGVRPSYLRWPLFRAGYTSVTGSYPGWFSQGVAGTASGAAAWGSAPSAYNPVYPSGGPPAPNDSAIAGRYYRVPRMSVTDEQVAASYRGGYDPVPIASILDPYSHRSAVAASQQTFTYDGGPKTRIPLPVDKSLVGSGAAEDHVITTSSPSPLRHAAYGEHLRPRSDGEMLTVQATRR